jgi:hypothetical protein
MTALEQLWERLADVRALAFVARSGLPGGWIGAGSGTVVVERADAATQTFNESGVWRPEGGRDLRFSNVFRWTIAVDVLRLEHLRFGPDQPVYLFDLQQAGEREWRSAAPHLCKEDCYTALLVVHDHHLTLRWSIDGPRKQEHIEYTYSPQESAS